MRVSRLERLEIDFSNEILFWKCWISGCVVREGWFKSKFWSCRRLLKQGNGVMRGSATFFHSFEMVSDGKYHMAELIAIKKNFTLRVDRGLARSIINEGARDFLHLTTSLFIGGVPPEAGHGAFTQWHLRNLTSFNGTFVDCGSRMFRSLLAGPTAFSLI